MFSCGNSKEVVDANDIVEEKSVELVAKKGILTNQWGEYNNSAYYKILNVTLTGNIMSIAISYNGGCGNHDFDLVGSAFIQKSLPPKRGIRLFHNANDDNCRELMTETLNFDITDFAYGNGEIILNLEHYNESITYQIKE